MQVKIKKEETKKPKSKFGKLWHWLWYSDSLLSWLVALAVAFIVVKFIFFPLLSFITGTSLPLVVVESSSMEHPQASFLGNVFLTSNSFNLWWNDKGLWYTQSNFNLSKEQAKSWPLRTGFDKGDIIVVWGRFTPKVGDVIIFQANTQHPIIHRIISIENTIQTKGDNNDGQLSIEKNIQESQIVGKAVFRIPKLGWIKLFFVEIWNGIRG